MDLEFVQDVICGKDDVVEEVYVLFTSDKGDYTIRFVVSSNIGFQTPEDEIEATDVVLRSIDLHILYDMSPGKYDVVDWKYVSNASIMDIERQTLEEDIPASEIGTCMRRIPLTSLQVDGNMVFVDGKKFYLKYVSSKPKDLFIKEVEVLSVLSHPNIIKVEALVTNSDGNVVGMITPFANGGTLDSNMLSPLRSMWLSQIKDAIRYSDEMGYPYTDIKPSNVVIHDNNAILIDFDGGTTKGWNMSRFEEYMTL